MQAARQHAWEDIVQTHSFGTEELNAPPKVLADLVEAVVGAVFLDTHQDLDATWKVHLQPSFPLSVRIGMNNCWHECSITKMYDVGRNAAIRPI